MPSPQRSLVSRTRAAWDRLLPRVTMILLFGLLILFLVASLVPSVGTWIESLQFGGPALIVGLAILFLDIISNERRGKQQAAEPFDDSLLASPLFVEAAARDEIDVDFAGDSAETLKILLRATMRTLEADARRSRKSLRVRILVPDLTEPLAVPCGPDYKDDPGYREENWRRTKLALGHIASELEEFASQVGLEEVSMRVRFHHLTPTVKLYLLNGSRALWALYRVERRVVSANPQQFVWDTRGTNAPVFLVSRDGTDSERRQFLVLSEWFSGLWKSVAYERTEYPDKRWRARG